MLIKSMVGRNISRPGINASVVPRNDQATGITDVVNLRGDGREPDSGRKLKATFLCVNQTWPARIIEGVLGDGAADRKRHRARARGVRFLVVEAPRSPPDPVGIADLLRASDCPASSGSIEGWVVGGRAVGGCRRRGSRAAESRAAESRAAEGGRREAEGGRREAGGGTNPPTSDPRVRTCRKQADIRDETAKFGPEPQTWRIRPADLADQARKLGGSGPLAWRIRPAGLAD